MIRRLHNSVCNLLSSLIPLLKFLLQYMRLFDSKALILASYSCNTSRVNLFIGNLFSKELRINTCVFSGIPICLNS